MDVQVLAFSGKFSYNVDSKGRVNIPAIIRSQLGKESDNTFHIAEGPNDCLFVYPRETFVHIGSKLEEQYGSLSSSDEERRYLLQTMANAHPSRCDQQGRIMVPQEHLDYAKIKDKVLIIGVFNKLEFWNPKNYERFMEESGFSTKERVQKFGGADRE